MANNHTATIRPMQRSDLKMVLAWRNHPQVRQFMFMQHEISEPEHECWFAQVQSNPFTHVLITETDHGPIGLTQFKNISKDGTADWGFYLAPHAPKGSGTALAQTALNFAFANLHLHKVCGQVLATNHASIKFHGKWGFKLEGILREHLLLDNIRHDLHCFGLLKHEWHFQNKPTA